MLAEQEERRRVAELLHDGPVQQLSAIAQMLDAGPRSSPTATPRVPQRSWREGSSSRGTQRATYAGSATTSSHASSTRSASRRQSPRSRRLSRPSRVEIDLDVSHAADLGENAAVALYQILREAAEQAVRRGPLPGSRSRCAPSGGGGVELVVADDGPPERRAAVLEALAERAATLNGRFSSEVALSARARRSESRCRRRRLTVRIARVEGNGRSGFLFFVWSAAGYSSSSELATRRGREPRSRTATSATASPRSRRRRFPATRGPARTPASLSMEREASLAATRSARSGHRARSRKRR